MKKILYVLTAFVLTLSLVACDTSDTVKYAVLGPMTGAYSIYGESVANGAELAAIELNSAGGVLGKELELVVLDNQGDADQAINNYNRAVSQEGVDAVIGGTLSGFTNAIKEYAVTDGVPVLTPTATAVDVTQNAANIFRACYLDSYQGSVMAQFAMDDLDSTNALVLYNSGDDYSVGLKDAFIATYTAAGKSADELTFSSDTVDFSSYISAIEELGYDAVFVPTYTDTVGPILTQAKNQGLDVPFLGGDGWDSIEADYADVAEGMYFGNHYTKSDESELVQTFVADYTAKFGEAPTALAALAYDAVKVMAAAMEDAGTTDYAEVVDALGAITFADGVTGSISFDETGNAVNKSISIITIEDGEQTLVKKVSAS
jgi:branched-chain amino acid transport system substrate-binding protein